MSRFFINILEFFAGLAVMLVVIFFLNLFVLRKLPLDKLIVSLKNKNTIISNLLSALLGAVTPFCVCTTIPVFVGMVQAGAGTAVAVSFLLASPLLNISAAYLISFLFGLKFAIYFSLAVIIFSSLGGIMVKYLKLEEGINPQIIEGDSGVKCASGRGYKEAAATSVRFLKQLLFPLLAGAVIAGFIHNYVPVTLVEKLNALPLLVVIPLMALIGFPLYVNILTLAPVCYSLVDKGMSQAAIITFMASGAGISLPTAIVLSRILKKKLFVFYLLYTFLAYCAIGLIFKLIA